MERQIIISGLTDKQKEIANSVFSTTAKYHIINASRQAGKTFLMSRLIMAASLKERCKILVVSPTYDQAKIIFDLLINDESYISLVYISKISKPFYIQVNNGTEILFKSAERPNNIRGGSYNWVFLDEFAFFKQGIFRSIIAQTTSARPNSKIVISSTPFGKHNDFYHLYLTSTTQTVRYKYYFMLYKDNPYYDIQEVESAKLVMPYLIFRQEYLGHFVDGSGEVFKDFSNCATITKYSEFSINSRYFAGIDFGRANDKTVITILNDKAETVYIEAMTDNWDIQVVKLGEILNRYSPIVYAESNGIGDPVITQLKRFYGNIKPFVTSNSSKKNIIEDLRYAFVTNKIRIPTIEIESDLHKELEIYTVSISKTGKIVYSHPKGEHDDYVDSLALAYHSFNEHNKGFKIYDEKIGDFYQTYEINNTGFYN